MSERIGISLPADQWNIVASGLAELPFKVAAPLLKELQRQVTEDGGRDHLNVEPGLPASRYNGDGATKQSQVSNLVRPCHKPITGFERIIALTVSEPEQPSLS